MVVFKIVTTMTSDIKTLLITLEWTWGKAVGFVRSWKIVTGVSWRIGKTWTMSSLVVSRMLYPYLQKTDHWRTPHCYCRDRSNSTRGSTFFIHRWLSLSNESPPRYLSNELVHPIDTPNYPKWGPQNYWLFIIRG